MQNIGFTKSEVDPNLYFLLIGSKPHILMLYVDDVIRIGVERLIAGCILDIALEFEMRDIRSMHHFLGICSKHVRSSLGRGSTNQRIVSVVKFAPIFTLISFTLVA